MSPNLVRFLVPAALVVAMTGCAAKRALQAGSSSEELASHALHASLDRWDRWRSLSALISVKGDFGDFRFAAKGHLFYLIGERYEIGFVKPFDRVVGNFYVTPQQVIYWDPTGSPKVYSTSDTLDLSRMLAFPAPRWDIRDILPFPVSGRTGDFRADSVWLRDGVVYLAGVSDAASHRFELDARRRMVRREWVDRSGRDPITKRFSRVRTYLGWPIATKVVCTDSTRRARLTWTLSDIRLDGQSLTLDTRSSILSRPRHEP